MAIHVPLHWHSAAETNTVVRGIQVFGHEGGKVQRLGPGGFNYIPAKMHHEVWASAGSLDFVTVDGAWDANWVKGPPTKANVNQKPPAK